MSVFVQYHSVFVPLTLWYSLKSGSMTPPTLLFLLSIVLAIYSLLCFEMNFGVYCSLYVMNGMEIMMGIDLNM
jgi:hypothetical protein